MDRSASLIADSCIVRLFRDGIRKILETESDMIVAGRPVTVKRLSPSLKERKGRRFFF